MTKQILFFSYQTGKQELKFVKEANWIAPVGFHVDAFKEDFAFLQVMVMRLL